MLKEINREIHLKAQPQGLPTEADFSLVTRPVPELGAGEILVRNHWMSVDPYMRGRMTNRKSYIPPFKLNEVLEGGAIGEVVESNSADFPVGRRVSSMLGWREYFVSNTSEVQKLPETDIPEQAFLGILGMPGMTAFTGLNTIAQLQPGDNVFISAASGAVGAIACQIAKLKGCYVAGSVGSEDKEKYLLDELGVDAVINYKTCGDLGSAIAEACPNGIDVYFENVGGAHLEAVLNLMNEHGRIAVCGMIDQYNATAPTPGPANLFLLISKKLTMRGFIVSDHWQGYPEFVQSMSAWIQNGDIARRETVLEGIAQAPAAFIGLFSGKNIGKMLVKLTD